MDVFYVIEVNSERVVLDPNESLHCVKVLRKQKGDQVLVTDGKGCMGKGEIVDENPRNCEILINERHFNYNRLSYELNIVVAPVKNRERFEWFLEKATEIGLSSVQPIICERSERRIFRIDRMENILISAMKQSVKAYKPILYEPISFFDWIDKSSSGAGYIAHCMEGKKELIWKLPVLKEYNVLIGPEGDFSPEEIQYALEKGITPVSMGSSRLRTETAGIVACSAISFINQ